MKKIINLFSLSCLLITCLAGCGFARTEYYQDNGCGFEINTAVDSSVSNRSNNSFNMYDEFILDEEFTLYEEEFNTEEYNTIKENSFEYVSTKPLSTFAADVDTGSYTNLRRMILNDYYSLEDIPSGAVRTEELLNYFDYNVKNKSDGKFSVQYETNTCPWNTNNDLLLMTVEANELDREHKGNNFVYLIDTSGSMSDFDKLGLAIESFSLLTENLSENDRVSIVTYAGDSNVLLDGCSGSDYLTIVTALNSLTANGGTNGSGGIEGAYDCALNNYITGGNNRVIIASDGDMNLGITSQSELVDLIKEKKESGVFLTTLGFGSGNYSDANMEQIADAGNGSYHYIDCIDEAERVLVDKLMQTTVTVAKDVKFQVEFNPNVVAEYRLLGYENRTMSDKDFEDDTKDGGEVGAGQQVTVLYEITYGGNGKTKDLKYQEIVSTTDSNELCTLSVRYKEPQENKSVLEEYPVEITKGTSSEDWKLAASLAELSMIIRDSDYIGDASLDEAYSLAKQSGTDKYRQQYVDILKKLGAKNKVDYVDKESTSGTYKKPFKEIEVETTQENSTFINLGTIDSTVFEDKFDFKVNYNLALDSLVQGGIKVENKALIENNDGTFTAEVIVDENKQDLVINTLVDIGFVNAVIE